MQTDWIEASGGVLSN